MSSGHDQPAASPSPDVCMCLAFDADSGEQGWRPCPPNLCEREDHEHIMGLVPGA